MRQTKLTKEQKEAIEMLIKEYLDSQTDDVDFSFFVIENLLNVFPKLTKKVDRRKKRFLKAEEKYERERYGKDCNCDVEKSLHI